MEHNTDLSALDRSTLRTWRILNLVGWGAASMLADALLLVTLSVSLGRLGVLLPTPLSWVVWGVALGLAGAGAGTVVAANVYRSPGFVAGYAATALTVLIGLLLVPAGATGTLVALWAAFIPNIACAAFVARRRWAKRPAALRSPA